MNFGCQFLVEDGERQCSTRDERMGQRMEATVRGQRSRFWMKIRLSPRTMKRGLLPDDVIYMWADESSILTGRGAHAQGEIIQAGAPTAVLHSCCIWSEKLEGKNFVVQLVGAWSIRPDDTATVLLMGNQVCRSRVHDVMF